MISGVAQVSVYGSQKYAVRVQVDPKALDGDYCLSLGERSLKALSALFRETDPDEPHVTRSNGDSH